MTGRADADREAQPALAEAVGGPLGMLETSLPGVAFLVAYLVTGEDTRTAAIVAVGVAAVLGAARVVRRESPRHAIAGVIGVAFAAFIAVRSGRAENFFLPGLLANAAYAAVFAGSIVVGRPLVGVVAAQLGAASRRWREDAERLRTYRRASWLWVGLFLARLAVQLPLYLAGAVVALGVARTAMGLPLFALGIWLTWRLVREARTAPAR